jgi:4-carboxymuconolactone decarboxylase
MSDLPPFFKAMKDSFPSVWDSQAALNQLCDESGPLDARIRELIKLAVLAASGYEQSVKGHTDLALAAGATPAEVRQAVLLAAGPAGIPAVAYGLAWVEEALTAAHSGASINQGKGGEESQNLGPRTTIGIGD